MTDFTNIGNSIYSEGDSGLLNSNIVNVNNSVIGFGWQSLQNAQIENATSVCQFLCCTTKQKTKDKNNIIATHVHFWKFCNSKKIKKTKDHKNKNNDKILGTMWWIRELSKQQNKQCENN